jgi:hypothetical protein
MSQIRVTSEGMKVKVDAHMRQQGPMMHELRETQ